MAEAVPGGGKAGLAVRLPSGLSPARRSILAVALAAIVAAALGLGTVLAAEPTQGAGPASAIRAVESVGMVVQEMDRSVRFFTEVLPFHKVSDTELAGTGLEHLEGVFGARLRTVGLRLGDERLDLIEYLAPKGRPVPVDSRSHDGWFQHVAIVVSDMDRAYRLLRDRGVAFASTGPQKLPEWNRNAAGIEAFYFKDPDGHSLEIIHFPKGKGDPRWQSAGDRLFLGIDHTAIVVRDTEASLRFYRDGLGFRVAGESENYGVEQEHLNNVFGARLRITAIRAAAGPGIEFLEYLAPSDGRPYPLDSNSNDLWQWQTRLVTGDADAAARAARAAGGRWVSPGAVDPGDAGAGFSSGAQVRDPDGHALILEAK